MLCLVFIFSYLVDVLHKLFAILSLHEAMCAMEMHRADTHTNATQTQIQPEKEKLKISECKQTGEGDSYTRCATHLETISILHGEKFIILLLIISFYYTREK